MSMESGRSAGSLIFRGVLAILFGIAALVWSGITLRLLVLLFGAYVLVDGGVALFTALGDRAAPHRAWVMLEGLAGIAAGLLTLFWPAISAVVLLYLIAGWAVATGLFEILAAIELRRAIRNEWLLVLSGILSVGFGVLVALFPGAGALGIVRAIAVYAILFGLLLVALGLRLRGSGRAMPTDRPAGSTA